MESVISFREELAKASFKRTGTVKSWKSKVARFESQLLRKERRAEDSEDVIKSARSAIERFEALVLEKEKKAEESKNLPSDQEPGRPQSPLHRYEDQVIENEKQAERSEKFQPQLKNEKTHDEIDFEYILQTRKAFTQLVEKSKRGKTNLAILLDGSVDRNLERLSSLIETAKRTLSNSVDQETELEKELQSFHTAHPQKGARDKEHDKELEQSRDTFEQTLRTLRYRNLLLLQRLFEVEIFAQRLNYIRLFIELFPKSMAGEISEWTRTASAIMSTLQKLSENTETPVKISKLGARVDSLEQAVQMAFIGFIKKDELDLTSESPQVTQFKKCLHIFQDAQNAHEKNYEFWSQQVHKGMENDHEFVIAISRLRCERYAELRINAERNAEIIQVAMTKRGVA